MITLSGSFDASSFYNTSRLQIIESTTFNPRSSGSFTSDWDLFFLEIDLPFDYSDVTVTFSNVTLTFGSVEGDLSTHSWRLSNTEITNNATANDALNNFLYETENFEATTSYDLTSLFNQTTKNKFYLIAVIPNLMTRNNKTTTFDGPVLTYDYSIKTKRFPGAVHLRNDVEFEQWYRADQVEAEVSDSLEFASTFQIAPIFDHKLTFDSLFTSVLPFNHKISFRSRFAKEFNSFKSNLQFTSQFTVVDTRLKHQLTFNSVFDFDRVNAFQDILAFTQTYESEGGTSPSVDTIVFNQQFTGVLVKTNQFSNTLLIESNFSILDVVTPPTPSPLLPDSCPDDFGEPLVERSSFDLTDGINTIVLPRPVLNNRDILNTGRVSREKLDGVYEVFDSGSDIERVLVQFEDLTDLELETFEEFMTLNLGKIITVTDHESQTYTAIIDDLGQGRFRMDDEGCSRVISFGLFKI